MPTPREVLYDPLFLAKVFPEPPGPTDSHDEVKDAVEALPEPERSIIELTFWGRATVREISEQLNMPRSSVFDIKQQAMEKLRGVLGDATGH